MRKKCSNLKKATMIIFLLAFLALAFSPTCKASSSTPTVYIDPPTIKGTTGEEYNATILAKDFEDLFTWGSGLSWDPEILNCTAFYMGYTLDGDVFDVLAPGVMTIPMSGGIDNIGGRITLSAVTLVGAEGVSGEPDVGYKLMKATFKVKASGVSDLHLTDVSLLDPDQENSHVTIIDYFTAWEENYLVEISTNSTGIDDTDIFGHSFNPATKKLSFNLTSISARSYATSTMGFCNITIPQDLMWVDAPTDWTMTINGGSPSTKEMNDNGTHYFLYFTYDHIGTILAPEVLEIEIVSTYVIPEFSTATILLLFLAFTLTTVLMRKLLRSTRYR